MSEIVFDESIYPRINGHDPAHVQELYENLESIEREGKHVIVNQNLTILNGRHRHLAMLKAADGDDPIVTVTVRETRDSKED